MSPSWIWSDKITNERVARVGYNHFISNKGEWNKFSNWVLSPIFISTILQSGKFLNLANYFPYDVKLRPLAHSQSFLANQKARNAIVRAENLLKADKPCRMLVEHEKNSLTTSRRRVVYEFFEIFPWVDRHNNPQLIDQSEHAHWFGYDIKINMINAVQDEKVGFNTA